VSVHPRTRSRIASFGVTADSDVVFAEPIDCGSNVLSGVEPGVIMDRLRLMLDRPLTWEPPPEYLATDVSGTVLEILLER
jgi:UDP-N-acetylglucosamine 2-epimerase (non-hydrolysing)